MITKPTCFVVGAAKSGTTALWKYFQSHPDIFVTDKIENKELGFYSNQYGIENEELYLSFFKEAREDQTAIEVCHAYLTSEESASRIYNEVKDAKIIIILRNPIDRAYSLYNWMVMHGYEKVSSFDRALEIESRRLENKTEFTHAYIYNYLYFESGLYYNQVKRYLELFGKDRVLILSYEEFKRDQLITLNRIFDFVGVKNWDRCESLKSNKSKRVVSVRLQAYVRHQLIKHRKHKRLKSLWTKIFNMNLINKPPKELSEQLRSDLAEKYKSDITSLSELCNKDFNKLWLS